MNISEIIEEFKSFIRSLGVEPPAEIIPDDGIKRFHIPGDKTGSLNGAYTLHTDGHPAGFFENHKTGIKASWKSNQPVKPLSKVEKKQLETAKNEAENKKQQGYERAALTAQKLFYNQSKPAIIHPYLERKQVNANDLRILNSWTKRKNSDDGSGNVENIVVKNVLLVPLIDIDGKLWNVQAIFTERHELLGRDKDFLTGGRLAGLFYKIGQDSDDVLICEGMATGLSLHKATGIQVLCAMTAGNILNVARIVRSAMPGKRIVICGDNDSNKPVNAGLIAAKKAAKLTSSLLAIPPVEGDFNDLANIKNSPYSILTTIKAAQPVNEKFEADRYGDQRVNEFGIIDGSMVFWRREKYSEVAIKLMANCVIFIKEEHLLDDGLRQEINFIIEGRRKNGKFLHPVRIEAGQFSNMQWLIKNYGTQAVMNCDQATPRRLALAVIELSGIVPRTTVYQHCGWRFIDNAWVYLTGSGAIGAYGLDRSVRVDLGGGHLDRYKLPEPPINPASVISHIFSLLTIAPNNPTIGVAIFCGVLRAVLGECLPIDFSIFMYGKTGVYKSQCAALALSFFGQFSSYNLTASFFDTANSHELSSHKTKDSCWVVDDLKPATSQFETNKIYALAERLFRSVGNGSARNRCNVDMTVKTAYYPRCMLFSNGEDIPKGSSILGRMLVVEFKNGDVDKSLLKSFQSLAETGKFASITSAFIQWLAPKIPELKKRFPEKVRDLRDKAIEEKFAIGHSRSPEIYANLYAAADIFLDFAVDVRGITHRAADDYIEQIDLALKEAIREQITYQKLSDEVERFCEILRSAFISGECHVLHHLTQGPPVVNPHTWGWRRISINEAEENAPINVNDFQKKLQAKGQAIGWINESESKLLLDADSTFKCVQKFATGQGEAFLMQKSTLFKHCLERGLIIDPDIESDGKMRPAKKQKIDTKRVRVMIFHTNLVMGDDRE